MSIRQDRAVHLAQLNIAKLTHPLEHPSIANFVDALAPINALAERSPGYVWRLQGESGDATGFRPHPDPEVIVNMSVWETPHALADFMFRTDHMAFLRRRTEWFLPMDSPQVVAWWIDEGCRPTIDEAFGRLAFLAEHGPSPYAFSVRRPQRQLAIRRATLADPLALGLIDELNAELTERYPEPGSNHFRLDPNEVVGDNGAFLIASLDDEAVGCGAFRVLGPADDNPTETVAEIKRMFIRSAARGLKVGAAILSELERRASMLGVTTMRLETGRRQHEAAARYERAGYRYCDCEGEYAGKPLSVCMTKHLGRR